jgi:hypothetical protein
MVKNLTAKSTRRPKTSRVQQETSAHHEAFLWWYRNDRTIADTCRHLQVPERTLHAWITRFKWHERADELDRKTNERLLKKAANDKAKRQAEMLKRHYDVGQALIAKGADFLQKNGLESGSQAISAMKEGVKIQRQSEGLPDWLIDLANKSPEELILEHERLSRELEPDEAGSG